MDRQEFVLHSHVIRDWVNLVTDVHNHMIKGENFLSGFRLCFLQQCMVEVLRDLEAKEKQRVADKIK